MAWTIEGAAHITHGDSAACSLRRLGAEAVLVRRDLLTIGLCDLDPAGHRALRMKHWGITDDEAAAGLLGVDDLGAALGALEAELPLVLWTTPTWSDRCFTWCVLDALERLGVEQGRVLIARPDAGSPARSLGAISDQPLLAAMQAARPLTLALASEGARLWRAFVQPSPCAFDQARQLGSSPFPDLASVAEGHGAWFPRREDKKVLLSEADALLFAWLDADWQSGTDLLRSPRGRAVVDRLFAWVGDSSVLERLEAWCAAGAVERSERSGTGWDAFAFRLTERGERLRDAGAADVGAFAPLAVGGCRINDPAQPWVRVGHGSSWSLAAG